MLTTRGLRNNNPGNIDRSAVNWQGQASEQPDPRFIRFIAPQYGIRALAKVLLSYQLQHHLRTVEQIVHRWAPPVENDTGAYVRDVAHAVGVDPRADIDLDSVRMMLPLVRAIIAHENGAQPYPEPVLMEGLHLAGIADATPAVAHPLRA